MPQPVPPSGTRVLAEPAAGVASARSPVPGSQPTAQLTGAPTAYERTVSAFDHSMHAPAILSESISSRSQNTAPDGLHVRLYAGRRFAVHHRPTAKG